MPRRRRRLLALASVFALLAAVTKPDATRAAADSGTNDPVRMTVAGDSLALGIGASDSSRGFAFDLFERIRALRPQSEVTNLAIGGATASDVVRLEIPRIRATQASLIVVEIGANDVVRRHSAATFARDFRTLLDGIRRSAPHARLVLFNVPDISVSPIFEASAKAPLHRLALAYNAIVTAQGRRMGAPVVDLFAFSKRASADPARYFSADQFHPSDEGHAAIASAAWPTLRRAIAARRSAMSRPRHDYAAFARRPVRTKSYSASTSAIARSSRAGSGANNDHIR